MEYKGYVMVFDNFFSSVELLEDLLDKGIQCVATTRTNRRKWPGDELKGTLLKVRGEYNTCMVGRVQAIVWRDSKVVPFLNTYCDPLAVTTVKRKEKDGTSTEVPCPASVAEYNQHMGGVDLFDMKRKLYSCSRKSKKWWRRLFWFLVDTAIVNAHILECWSPNHNTRTLKEFRIALATEYLDLFSCRGKPGRPSTGHPSTGIDSHPDTAYSHWPSDRRTSRRRCANCSNKGLEVRTWYECSACEVGLCPECFETYHS